MNATNEQKALAYKGGLEDGSTMARERIFQLSERYVQTGPDECEQIEVTAEEVEKLNSPQARNFDESLVNAIGRKQVCELFGLSEDASDEAWGDTLAEYERGAVEGWTDTIDEAVRDLNAEAIA